MSAPKTGTPPAKKARVLERIIKGFASHRRIEILFLLKKKPELSVEDISSELNIGYKNTAEHIRKMTFAGLLLKRSYQSSVLHKLTERAEVILMFCRTLE